MGPLPACAPNTIDARRCNGNESNTFFEVYSPWPGTTLDERIKQWRKGSPRPRRTPRTCWPCVNPDSEFAQGFTISCLEEPTPEVKTARVCARGVPWTTSAALLGPTLGLFALVLPSFEGPGIQDEYTPGQVVAHVKGIFQTVGNPSKTLYAFDRIRGLCAECLEGPHCASPIADRANTTQADKKNECQAQHHTASASTMCSGANPAPTPHDCLLGVVAREASHPGAPSGAPPSRPWCNARRLPCR